MNLKDQQPLGIYWIIDLCQPQFDEEAKIIAILFVVHKQDR